MYQRGHLPHKPQLEMDPQWRENYFLLSVGRTFVELTVRANGFVIHGFCDPSMPTPC